MKYQYKCSGGQGCNKPGCIFVSEGKPQPTDNKPYICPYNHWRSCQWEKVEEVKEKEILR